MARPLPRAGRFICALVLLFGGSAPASSEPAATRTRLVVYTALEPVQHALFKSAIEAAVPDVDVDFVWGATGVMTDRLLAEGGRSGADMVIGLAATSMVLLKKAELLAPYRPTGVGDLRAQFVDGVEPYSWTGMDAYFGVILFNTALGQREQASPPVSWRDLLLPSYRGRIAMPDPRRSGTGYMLVAGWLQSMGEAAGWAFMDALDANVTAYMPSGSAPCDAAAHGDVLVGLSFDLCGATAQERGDPVRIVAPIDGVGWEEEAFAVLRASPKQDLARRVADWAASPEANRFYARFYPVVAHPAVAPVTAHHPSVMESRMIRTDLLWVAENRERVLAEWARRYAAKASP